MIAEIVIRTGSHVLNQLSIRWRISLVGFVTLPLALIAAAAAIYHLSVIRTETAIVAREDIPITKMLSGITVLQLEQAVLFERAIGSRGRPGRALQQVVEESKAGFLTTGQKASALFKSLATRLGESAAAIEDDRTRFAFLDLHKLVVSAIADHRR